MESIALDLHELRRLASDGIERFAPARLFDAAQWCWDRAETTGDGRYCPLARALERIALAFEDDGHLPLTVVEHLNAALAQELPAVLDASTAETGALLGRLLRERLEATPRT